MYNGKLGIRDFFVALLDETGRIGVVEDPDESGLHFVQNPGDFLFYHL